MADTIIDASTAGTLSSLTPVGATQYRLRAVEPQPTRRRPRPIMGPGSAMSMPMTLRVERLAAGSRATLRLLIGVALALSGLAITGGSFGMFAFIGIPLMAVGLGMITS